MDKSKSKTDEIEAGSIWVAEPIHMTLSDSDIAVRA